MGADRGVCVLHELRVACMTDSRLPVTCAFCGNTMVQGSRDIVFVSVESPSIPDAADLYYAHRGCLVRLLAEGIPPGEVLEGESS
jgi:hypothetical protein